MRRTQYDRLSQQQPSFFSHVVADADKCENSQHARYVAGIANSTDVAQFAYCDCIADRRISDDILNDPICLSGLLISGKIRF